jgi:hypothetical protein
MYLALFSLLQEFCVSLEKEVGEVDLAGLLVGRSFVFEETGDAERVLEGVELGGLLEDGVPLLEGFASLVGIGEDDYFVIDQGGEELGLEHLESTTRHPDTLRTQNTHDYCCLLGLDNTDHGVVFDHGLHG